MRFFGEIIRVRLEQIAGVVASVAKGIIYYNTSNDRPYCDDGAGTAKQIMLEQHLPEARRSAKVQLDASGTGLEVSGTLGYTLGGTGVSSLTGKKLMALVVKSDETGFEFAEVEMLGSDSQVGAETAIGTSVKTVTAPANAIGCYVQADENNSADLRIAWGTANPTVSTGVSILPGATEFLRTSANIKVIAESGTTSVLNYTWLIK